MADAKTILDELWDDNDRIKVYDGAGKEDGFTWAQLPDAGWWAWDLRGWVKQLAWDLLRFQKPSAFSHGDIDKKWGMRDSITRVHFLAEQNNKILRRLAGHAGVDISDLP